MKCNHKHKRSRVMILNLHSGDMEQIICSKCGEILSEDLVYPERFDDDDDPDYLSGGDHSYNADYRNFI